jgi:hypothetical protein
MPATVRLEPRDPNSVVPLLGLQRPMWLDFEAKKYSQRTCHGEVRIHTAIDPTLIQKSLNILIQRHEVLRTRYLLIDDVPQAQIDIAAEAKLEISNLADHQHLDDEKFLQFAEQFLVQKIDLSIGPLFAAKLLRLSDRESVLILSLDHMISDGVSTGILCTELCTIYKQLSQQSVVSLPKLVLQFADLAVWQARVREHWLNEHEPYWKRYLLDAPRVHLPTDSATQHIAGIGRTLCVPLGALLSADLRALARSTRTPLSLVVLTIYIALMSRWLSLDELLLLILTHRRFRPELHGMVGLIAGDTLLRIRIRKEDSFIELMPRVCSEFHNGCKHQCFDFLPRSYDSVETDLFFNWLPHSGKLQSLHHTRVDDLEIRVQPFDFWSRHNESLKFRMSFSETSAGIVATIVYRDNRISTHTIEQLRLSLLLICEEFVRRPRSRILDMPRF